MAVDATLLFREVEAIAAAGENNSNYMITCRVQAGGQWRAPFRLDLYSLERDYENGFGDLTVVEFMIGLGVYTYQFVPNRGNLLVELQFIPIPDNTKRREAQETITLRFRGILMEQANQGLVGKHSQATTEEALDRVGPIQVQMQLVDEAVYRARMTTLARIYRNVTPMDVLRAVLTDAQTLGGGNDNQRILGVNTVAGFNTDVRNQISIPHDTTLIRVPTLLQEKEGGVYATGLGCYLQNQYWYAFPLYDTTRFLKTPRSLTVLNIPKNRAHGSERTYRTTTNQVLVLATGDASALDRTVFDYLNEGNGIRFADARKLMTSFAVTDRNRMLVDRATNLFEVAGDVLKDGFNNLRWASERATSNPFKHYSDLARKKGTYVTVEWMHGDADLLYPGMPVKFLTVSNDELKTFTGSLLGVHEQRIPAEAGVAISRYPSSIRLKLFLDTAPLDEDVS
jgi:hypothetical protein